MAAPTRDGTEPRTREPVRLVSATDRSAIRDDRYAGCALDPRQAQDQLRLGADHLWHHDPNFALASQPRRNAQQSQAATHSASVSRNPEEVQIKSREAASGDE